MAALVARSAIYLGSASKYHGSSVVPLLALHDVPDPLDRINFISAFRGTAENNLSNDALVCDATRKSAQDACPRAKNASPANVPSGGYVSTPCGHTHIPGPFLARRPEGQSRQKFLNRPGASAVYLWVETTAWTAEWQKGADGASLHYI